MRVGFLGALEPKGRDKTPEDPAPGVHDGTGDEYTSVWKESTPQPISRPRNIWERLQRDVETAKSFEIFEAISGELKEAIAADTAAQQALWREKSAARRQGRRPHPRFAREWVATGDRIHQLKIEAGLHCKRPERNEWYFDPALAFGPAPARPSVSDQRFRRHP